MNNVSENSIVIGSYSLETLTTGMYENPQHCLREYVQNSFDSICSARTHGLLKANGGVVTVAISGSSKKPTLTITDDGEGIAADLAVSTLVSVGASRKRSTMNAGFRGIGRLAGIAYCTTLRFTTTHKGEDKETIVEFDCGRMRSYMRPGAEVQEVREVIRLCTRNETRAAPADSHGMQVEMVGLVGVGLEFVEIDELIPYLRQVAPVDYSDRYTFAPRIRGFCESIGSPISVIEVETRYKRERKQVLKGYDDAAPTGKKPSKIYDLELISSPELGWHAWIGKTSFQGEITDDSVAGVRFRVKNIQVGSSEIIEELASELTASGTEGRLQRWAVGEVFITNPSVVPNARRDGFEDSAAWRQIKKEVRLRVAKRVVDLVRGASKSRTKLKSIKTDMANLDRTMQGTPENEEAIDQLIALADRTIGKLSTDKLPGIDPSEIGEMLAKVKGQRDALIEEKGRIKKHDKDPLSGRTVDTGATDDPQAGVGESERTEDVGSEDADKEDEAWSDEALLAALIDVLISEFGEDESKRLMQKARENLSAE